MNLVDPEMDNTPGVLTSHKQSRKEVRPSPSNYIRATLADERRTTGRAFVLKEVIVADDMFITPRLLKLSCIGLAEELAAFNIRPGQAPP
ncbi:hypothetical protein CTA1_12379 [Colletotrichum tanaceti]|uniref:Uncharacterized protein n=1 Tax=Colletotrichum tanaceti TaxID=1306861 RepID=A0A4U6XM61_9PEZI|nr:hypothetical protein CTA1_12379 [Colletotrichum tanaceti]